MGCINRERKNSTSKGSSSFKRTLIYTHPQEKTSRSRISPISQTGL